MRVVFKAQFFFSCCLRASECSSTIDTEASNFCEHKLGFLCLEAAIDRAATLSELQGKPFFFLAAAVFVLERSINADSGAFPRKH